MKRLEIKNFVKSMNDVYSDFFEVKHCSDSDNRYIIGLGIRDVVSFKPLKANFKPWGPKYDKMSIDKKTNEDGNYHIWLWDVGENISYPMSIMPDALSSLSEFTKFLNHTLKLANDGDFSGDVGNRVDN
jgi:hypothetical protein